jgi:energy-coupling factor transport system ATP-binding protein
MIEIQDVRYTYGREQPGTPPAVAGVTLSIPRGQVVGLLGENGSGKSTLARLLAGILTPNNGVISVDGIEMNDHARRWEARQKVGLVFQNPDDQLIANTLLDEIAFGPENLGLPRATIKRNVDEAIALMELGAYLAIPLSDLSLGQRQRVAIAGVLAMEPRYIILDEPSSMLPAQVATRLIQTLTHLAREREIGVIWITHHMEEVVGFDRVVVMSHGAVALDGAPHEALTQTDRLRALKLDAPPAAALAERLRARGYVIAPGVIAPDELAERIRDSVRLGGLPAAPVGGTPTPSTLSQQDATTPLLETRALSYTYLSGTQFAQQALRSLSSRIAQGALVAFVGPTRAGKSTLLDCLNGVVKPGKGMLFYKGKDIAARGFDLAGLRRAVGVVYQSPDSQMLEDIVGKDVAFSLIRRKAPLAESRRRVQESLEAVGLPYEEFRNRYTYALSGGEKRRVAIAGALAAEPEALVLDEPMAGLDPSGRADFFNLIQKLRARGAMTIIYMSSSLDEITSVADYLYILDAGAVALEGPPEVVMRQLTRLDSLGVGLASVSQLAMALAAAAPGLDTSCRDLDGLEASLVACLAPVSSHAEASANEEAAL